jgi:ribosomal protein S21
VASSSRLPIRYNSTNTPDLPPTSTFIANTPPRAVRNPFASGRNPSWNSLALVEQSEQVGGLMVRDGQGRPIPKPRTSVNEWWKTISAKRDNYSAGDQYLGRTINIPRGADFQKAYRQLNGIMRDANIKKDKLRQEFYEKPSEKRVRLASERHRRRFAQMVSTAIRGACSGRSVSCMIEERVFRLTQMITGPREGLAREPVSTTKIGSGHAHHHSRVTYTFRPIRCIAWNRLVSSESLISGIYSAVAKGLGQSRLTSCSHLRYPMYLLYSALQCLKAPAS